MSRPLLVALALLAAAGPAGAREGAPVAGDLALGGAVRLAGEGTVASPEGTLNLTRAVEAGEPLSLAWADARGWLVTTTWTQARLGPLLHPKMGDDPANETLRGAGRLRGFACGEACAIVAFGLGGEGTRVGLAGALEGELTWLPAPHLDWADYSEEGKPDSFRREVLAGAYVAGHGTALPGEATPFAEGRVGVFVRGATVVLEQAGGARTLDASVRREAAADPAGAVGASRTRSAFLYLELEGATLQGAPATRATLLAPGATLDLAGRLAAANATGALRLGARDVLLREEDIGLDGRWRLDLDPLALPGARALPLGDAPAPAPRGRVEGEATLHLAGAQVSASPIATPAAAGIAAALLLALALVALYSRIRRASVLDQPRRRLVLEALLQSPGSTAADLARATGLNKVLVQYHLRFLASHALVVGRRDGRRVHWFSPVAAPGPGALAVELALHHESRRRVAAAIAGAGQPLTQAELSGRTSLSPRLVSYHLAHLEACGLVRREGARPARYLPSPLLADALDRA